MKCPDEGRILMYLEKELPDAEMLEIEAHLQSCPNCLKLFAEMEENYNISFAEVRNLYELSLQAEVKGQQKIWNKVKNKINIEKREGKLMKIKKMAIAAAVVLAIGIVGSMPSVQAVAGNLLQVFRVQTVDTITMDFNDMQLAMEQGNESFDIDKFGKIETIGIGEEITLSPDELGDLSFKVKIPALADKTELEYALEKVPAIEITPDVKNVNRILKSVKSEYMLPEALDGKICSIKMGDAVEICNNDYSIMQCPSPEIEVPQGIDVSKVARAIVALPIWPDDVRRQLEAIDDWEHTLLIPTDDSSKKVKVNGKKAVLLDEGWSPTLIWQEDGILYCINDYSEGNIDLIAIAESLR